MTDFVSFDEWLERNKAEFLVMVIECPKCIGTGTTECSCCGSEIDCAACDGTGRLMSEGGEQEVDKIAARRAYNKQLIADAMRMKSWPNPPDAQ